ncbi:DUF1501 domain-containing protein [Angustibacter aerolatus]
MSTDLHDCTCAEGSQLSRRSLLKRAAAGTALAAAATATDELVSSRYAYATGGYTGDVLIVLSLRGGFDGLSAVAPVNDPDYQKLRPTIRIPVSQAIQLDDTFGMHPALAPLKPYWDAGSFGVVHAVGQESPTRSHFQAMDELERAAPGTGLRTGWLDRTLGLRPATSAFQAAQVGGSGVSPAFAGPSPELALGSVDAFQLSGAGNTTDLARWRTALSGIHDDAPSQLAAPARSTLAAVGKTFELKSAGYTPENGASYSTSSTLAKALRDVARLIKAGVGLQVAAIDIGDWDMHAGLGSPGSGWMRDKLSDLATSLASFARDMGPTGLTKVTVVTLSEFGRRAGENGSGGLDHGHGNAVLMLGGGVAGGQVHGRWPGLGKDQLVDGDLAGTTSYRTVLGEILQKRCGAGSLSAVFPGLSEPALGVASSA